MRTLTTFLVFLAGTAAAGTVPLSPYDGPRFTVSMPRSWTVTSDAERGVIVAEQDPRREDAAMVLLIVRAADGATSEEQVLDGIVRRLASGLEIRRREALDGGGHALVADGDAGGVRVRLGAVAILGDGTKVVSLLAAKPGEFDRLGGIDLVIAILSSIQPLEAPPGPPEPAAPPADAPAGQLVVPAPMRALTFADLAGEWARGDSTAITNYVSRSPGQYAGFDAISIRETWTIDAKGKIRTHLFGVHTGGSLQSVAEKHGGTISLLPDGEILQINRDDKQTINYVIRGWLDGPNGTVLKLNGPYYRVVPQDVLADPHRGWNLDTLWLRKPKPPAR